MRFFVFLANVSISIRFERNHFRFYIISVLTNTIVSVSVNVESIISVSVIVSVTEISLHRIEDIFKTTLARDFEFGTQLRMGNAEQAHK